jgi:hypothetical protein
VGQPGASGREAGFLRFCGAAWRLNLASWHLRVLAVLKRTITSAAFVSMLWFRCVQFLQLSPKTRQPFLDNLSRNSWRELSRCRPCLLSEGAMPAEWASHPEAKRGKQR